MAVVPAAVGGEGCLHDRSLGIVQLGNQAIWRFNLFLPTTSRTDLQQLRRSLDQTLEVATQQSPCGATGLHRMTSKSESRERQVVEFLWLCFAPLSPRHFSTVSHASRPKLLDVFGECGSSTLNTYMREESGSSSAEWSLPIMTGVHKSKDAQWHLEIAPMNKRAVCDNAKSRCWLRM
eukprot:563905-Amphidinium_carterae.1